MGKLQLIEEAHDTVNKLGMRLANAKAEYDSAKKLLDQAEKRRNQIIAIGEDALKEQTPLFKDGDEATNGKAEKKPSKKAANEAAVASANGKEQWRHLPISDAIKIGAVVNQLAVLSPPVTTLGELQLWLKKGGKLIDLPGVSEVKMQKALDHWDEFFRHKPQFDLSIPF